MFNVLSAIAGASVVAVSLLELKNEEIDLVVELNIVKSNYHN